jgi:hypothetical protein
MFSILYLRVGEGELSLVHLPEYIIPFLLKNAPLKVGHRTVPLKAAV